MNNNNYGFRFSDIIHTDDLFIKRGKNNHGRDKIQNEISFYLEIEKKGIKLSIPELHRPKRKMRQNHNYELYIL